MISVSIGYLPYEKVELPPPTIYDRLYFIGEQLIEILLLTALLVYSKHYILRYTLKACLSLSSLEMIDEILGLNFGGFDKGAILLIIFALYFTVKKIKSVKSAKRNNGHLE